MTDAETLAERFWRIHPSELDTMGLTREQFYAREIQALVDAAYAKALSEAASVASLYIINRNSIHPDVAFDDIAPNVQMIAHSTCQYVAEAIRDLAQGIETAGSDKLRNAQEGN